MKVRIDNQILGVNGLTEAEVVYNHVKKLEKFVFVSKLWELWRTQKDLNILVKIPNNYLQFVIAKSLQFGASQYKCSYLLEQIQLFRKWRRLYWQGRLLRFWFQRIYNHLLKSQQR